MTKEEIQAQIKELQDKLNILSTELEKCENEQVLSIRKPKSGELYNSIYTDGTILNSYNEYIPIGVVDDGNYWFTYEEAEFEAQREKYTRLYRKYVKEHSEPMKHLYIKLERFYAYWDIESQTIEIANHKGYIDAFQIYGSSEEVIRNAIKFIGEDNFKKYILEIKE